MQRDKACWIENWSWFVLVFWTTRQIYFRQQRQKTDRSAHNLDSARNLAVCLMQKDRMKARLSFIILSHYHKDIYLFCFHGNRRRRKKRKTMLSTRERKEQQDMEQSMNELEISCPHPHTHIHTDDHKLTQCKEEQESNQVKESKSLRKKLITANKLPPPQPVSWGNLIEMQRRKAASLSIPIWKMS